LNKLCGSLCDPRNREAFKRDEEGYMARFHLSEEEKNHLSNLSEALPALPFRNAGVLGSSGMPHEVEAARCRRKRGACTGTTTRR